MKPFLLIFAATVIACSSSDDASPTDGMKSGYPSGDGVDGPECAAGIGTAVESCGREGFCDEFSDSDLNNICSMGSTRVDTACSRENEVGFCLKDSTHLTRHYLGFARGIGTTSTAAQDRAAAAEICLTFGDACCNVN